MESEMMNLAKRHHRILHRLAFEDQDMNHNGVADKNESEMPEYHVPTNQPNGQMVDDVIVEIDAILREEQSLPTRSCCIYKVPHIYRELNKDAYAPKVVSIGPFHYGNSRLQNMERIKKIFFKEFIKEAQTQTSLNDLVSFVKSLEPEIRACYSENIKLSTKKLVKVILVDASFIIELFWSCHSELLDDAVLSKPWLDAYVRNDLLSLENQLPYFILEELFNRAFPLGIRRHRGLPSFLELTFNFFSYHNTQDLEPKQNVTINHFTDLLRIFYLPREKHDRKDMEWVLSYNASELYEAGVKFKTSPSKCLLDLNFSRGVFEIPQIIVEDKTQTMFLNMLALEQCHYPEESYFSDYTLILDWLINTSKDVDVLVKEGIICNYLADSNEVAKLFNKLHKNFVRSNFNSNYYHICERLNGFYKNPLNNMQATLRRDYCKTPWQTVASFAGIFLLILTIVQTIFSIIK